MEKAHTSELVSELYRHRAKWSYLVTAGVKLMKLNKEIFVLVAYIFQPLEQSVMH